MGGGRGGAVQLSTVLEGEEDACSVVKRDRFDQMLLFHSLCTTDTRQSTFPSVNSTLKSSFFFFEGGG